MEASPEQLQEYEKQLADIEELLKASPDDESLLSLKSDLSELVALTKDTLAATASDPVDQDSAADAAVVADSKPASSANEVSQPVHAETAPPAALPSSTDFSAEIASFGNEEEAVPDSQAAAVGSEPPKKKPKKIKDFEVPQRLVPLETDSEAEIKRKRRAIKALKREHRNTVKTAESQKKQKSWQSFQKKKKLGKDSSIFATHDGESKVGVVSGRSKTEFNERTRHTY